MSSEFRALRVFKTDAGQETRLVTLTDADLMDGDVDVRVDYSTLNYKDGLAMTGRAPVVRTFPLTPGIDFAGVVERSDHAGFSVGDRVVLDGWGAWPRRLGSRATGWSNCPTVLARPRRWRSARRAIPPCCA